MKLHRAAPLALVLACSELPDSGGAVATCVPLEVAITDRWETRDLVASPADLSAAAGLAPADLDGDGDLDLWLATTGGSVAFAGDGRGGLAPGASVTVDGAPNLPSATSVAAADYDRDGDIDLFLGGTSGQSDRLLVGDGSGAFVSVVLPDSQGESSSGAWADVDGDGRLDLLVGRGRPLNVVIEEIVTGALPGDPSSLYLQQPDGTLALSIESLPDEIADGHTYQIAPIDYDADGDLDLYLANDFGPYVVPDRLLENIGSAHFEVAEDCSCSLAHYGMGVAVGDADGNGTPDLLITDIGGPDLLLNLGDGTFADATLASRADLGEEPTRLVSWGARFVDLDASGTDDLAVAFGRLNLENGDQFDLLDQDWQYAEDQFDALLLAVGDGSFDDAGSEVGIDDPARHRPLAVADLDGDRRPELILAGRDDMVVHHFEGGCESALVVDVLADERSAAIGARVVATTEAGSTTRWVLPASTGSSSVPTVFVGLGSSEEADIEVTWLDGRTLRIPGALAGTEVVADPSDAAEP